MSVAPTVPNLGTTPDLSSRIRQGMPPLPDLDPDELARWLREVPSGLLAILDDAPAPDRKAALQEISRPNDWAALASLSHWDSDWEVRLSALKQLYSLYMRGTPDLEAFAEVLGTALLSDGSPQVRDFARTTLMGLEPDTLGQSPGDGGALKVVTVLQADRLARLRRGGSGIFATVPRISHGGRWLRTGHAR